MEESQMGMPALKLESEEPVIEERVARLEEKVEHIQSDVSEIKTDVRRSNDKIDAVNQKVDDFRVSVEKSFAAVGERIADLKTGRAYDRVWWLLIAAALLGVMAKGFGWI
jgi:predicted  nucleic acid-binding Zn-ribbon protein